MKSSHSVFVTFLVIVGTLALISLSVKGWNYYLTPLDQRPFHADYADMKPSGPYSHGLGIIGSVLIIIGVSLYSCRKRMRSLWNLGKLSRWLEFHIFLCLVGPTLVIYHTTFKEGGIAAITLWTMLSVVASGVIGRFLYTQIPRNLNGTELTLGEIRSEMQNLGTVLEADDLGARVIRVIDNAFEQIQPPAGIVGAVNTFFHLEQIKVKTHHSVHLMIEASHLPVETAKKIQGAASERASLLQKSVLLSQVERLFYYWHAIHLPFTVIMFITLAAHVTVSILLGYRWIF